jgi:spermidine/putrescine transport system permease protein
MRRIAMKKASIGNPHIASPYVIWSLIFILVPLFMVGYYSFTDETGAFSLGNITQIIEYNYLKIFGVSILYAFIATVITLLISYPLAYFMTKLKASSQGTLMLLVMLPMWMNLLIRTYSLSNILERNGIINTLLENMGFDKIKLINTPGAVILGMIYNFIPYMILPIYSALSKLDKSLTEASSDLGGNAFTTLRRVIIPLSMPGVVSGITMVFVPSVSTFYISQKLGGIKNELIGDVIEQQFKLNSNYNLGAALSLILMVMIIISLIVMNKFASDDDGGVIV